MKKQALLLALIAVLLVSLAFPVQSLAETTQFTDGDFTYKLDANGNAEITDWEGKATTLQIPSELDGHRVTSIGDDAFSYCDSLTSVTIPDSVTSIVEWSFAFCESLTSITIPDSVTSIGVSAFSGCSSLTSVTIPNSVTSIGYMAFRKCDALTSITIPDSVVSIDENPFGECDSLSIVVSPNHPTLATIDGVLFDKNDKRLVCYPCSKNDDVYDIPQGTKIIGYDAFTACNALTSVTIPDSVTSIEGGAFYDCSSLKSVIIPDGVTSIGTAAFFNCTSLTSVSIPASVTSIDDDVFGDCSSLTLTIVPGSYADEEYVKLYTIPYVYAEAEQADYPGDFTYELDADGNAIITKWAGEATTLNIPSTLDGHRVTSIGKSAFMDCNSLISITIPDSVISIGDGAFDDCPSLTLALVRDSYAEEYAKKNNIPYVYSDSNDWLNS